MRSSVLLGVLLFLTALTCPAQQLLLSPHSRAYVITCGPGQDELYAAFGHSAFRISDPSNGIDWVYNYGVFDFDQTNFYLNFARGYLHYKLAVGPYDRFVYVYQYYNRFVHEQELSLDLVQRQQLFDFLQWNALPENQYYRYDYFYDNCATRIRDALAKVFGESVTFDGSYISENRSFRQLTDLYLKRQPWGDLGIDVCLGLPMDKLASSYEHMFLPDYISDGFKNATITDHNNTRPLIRESFVTYAAIPAKPPFPITHPAIVFGVVLVLTLAITVRDLRLKQLTRAWDVVLFSAAGVVGLLLVFLWTATDHEAARGNFNVLWALPTHLLIFMTLGSKKQKWISNYFLRFAVLVALLLVSWYWLPQQMNTSLLPLVAALGVRAYAIGILYRDSVSSQI